MSAQGCDVAAILESHSLCARGWLIGGRVQGVGFRPFVHRLAHRHGLAGWVRNLGGSVQIHAEGPLERLQSFEHALLSQAPPASSAQLLEVRSARLEHDVGFEIRASGESEAHQVHVPLDLFTCDECLDELADPGARRHRYPFINCTQCGPRYTLIRAMPYDRPNTTLDSFRLCAHCAAEYADPLDRRFHAQPLACPVCGPALYWRELDLRVSGGEAALRAALAALREGRTVAMRGVGGYHLLCDALRPGAVARLRERKRRPAKPLAVMVPWEGRDGIGWARRIVRLSALEADELRSASRPIVLAATNTSTPLAASAAPGLRELGVMLPYSPLHHLLLQEFGGPLIATSGNISGEPVLTEPEEAEERLAGIADGFLHHNRPIMRPADDPVVRVTAGRVRPLRLGRGTAPLELRLPQASPVPILAVGAHSKVTVALAWDDRVVVSPHIGELTSPRGRQVFAQTARDLQQLYGVRAERLAHDAHPDFPGSRWAKQSGLPVRAVWHHEAHASALAGEHPGEAPLLCFTWDGVGLGPDGTLWGGEALLGRPAGWRRVGSWRPFRLPGGERAARDPWRSALALIWTSGLPWPRGTSLFDPLLRSAWERGLNAPATTAVGRLFDAAAALLDICSHASYEGEAPMRLEALVGDGAAPVEPVVLPLNRGDDGIWRSDWAPLVPALLDERGPPALRAAMFHASLAQALLGQALAVREETAVERVGLCGGVFQNRLLTEQAQSLLLSAGFEVLVPVRMPLNDSAVSFGQIVEVIASLRNSG